MATAGEYSDLFTRQARTLVAAGGKGEKQPAFTAAGTLWGVLEDAAAEVETEKDSRQQVTRGTVRVRNHPPLNPGDRLTRAFDGVTFDVLTVRRGRDELVCEVETP